MSVVAGLRLAVGTLTVVPVGSVGETTPGVARYAMTLAPVAALPVGVVAGTVAALGTAARLPSLATAGLVLAGIALATRAMHVDGLADTVDGLGAGWERQRALDVMRRGDVGPMGAAALVLVLLLQASAIATLVLWPFGWLIVALAVVVSRAACTVTCTRGIPAARPGGLGAAVAGSVPVPFTAVVVLLAAALLTGVTRWAGQPWWVGPFAVAAAVVVVAALTRTCVRVFGGVTGDVMGAGVELALAALLIVCSAGVGR